MNDPRRGELGTEVLAAYLEGEVTPSEAEAVDAELADSAAARRRLAGLQRIREALSSSPPDLESTDLVASLRGAIETSAPTPRRAPRWTWALAAAGCLAAGLALAVVRPSHDEFRAKSAVGTASRTRWAGIQPYYVDASGVPQRLTERLPAAAGLLFSYTNLGPRPFEFLLVFAVDARGKVHWCHPAYELAGTDPIAIRIRKGDAEIPLPEVIHLELAPGPATLHALFTAQPLHVSEVEAWLQTSKGQRGTSPWPDVVDQVLAFEITP